MSDAAQPRYYYFVTTLQTRKDGAGLVAWPFESHHPTVQELSDAINRDGGIVVEQIVYRPEQGNKVIVDRFQAEIRRNQYSTIQKSNGRFVEPEGEERVTGLPVGTWSLSDAENATRQKKGNSK